MPEPVTMPEGLERLPQEFKQTRDERLKSAKAVDQQIHELAGIIKDNDSSQGEYLKKLGEEYKTSMKSYLQAQTDLDNKIVELARAGASSEEIGLYLKRNSGQIEEMQATLSKNIVDIRTSLSGMATSIKFEDPKKELLAFRQLKAIEKATQVEEETNKKKLFPFFEKITELQENIVNGYKEGRNKGLSQVLSTLTGPIRMIADPFLELAGTDTESAIKSGLDKITEKFEKKDKDSEGSFVNHFEKKNLGSVFGNEETLDKREKKVSLEEPKQKKKLSVDDEQALLGNTAPKSLLALPAPSAEEEEPKRISPRESELLSKGGAVGAGAVYIGNILEKHLAKNGSAEVEAEQEGFLDDILDGKIPGLSKAPKGVAGKGLMASRVSSALGIGVPLAMLAGGAVMQARDSRDAGRRFKEGDVSGGIESTLLGDRNRITEETAGKEMGRATTKNALLAGGITGTAVAGGAAAAAGGAALAGGAGLAGAGAAALGAVSIGAVLPPVLIAAAIAAGATAVAKGTQEAYELQYDKNAMEIQRSLTRKIADPDAKMITRIGASIDRDWKALTSTMAGGIRGITDELAIDQEKRNEEQLQILKSQADKGNEESKRLFELMTQDSFKKMNDKQKERLLRENALYDEYQEVQNKTTPNIFENLIAPFEMALKTSEGVVETAHQNLEGRILGEWEKSKLKKMDTLKAGDIAQLKNSESYKKAIESGQDSYKALQQAYLDQEKAMAKAQGKMKADGSVVDVTDIVENFASFLTGTQLLSDEALKQSKSFRDRKLLLKSQGKSEEEASAQALEEMKARQENEMEFQLKQTEEYKDYFDNMIKLGRSKEDAEKEALAAVKKDKNVMADTTRNVFQKLGDVWKTYDDFVGGLQKKVSEGFSTAVDFVTGKSNDRPSPVETSTAPGDSIPTPYVSKPDGKIDDGIVKTDGTFIQTSPDDTIIATKNTPRVVGDVETRKAMPPVPGPLELNDKNIVAVLQSILSTLQAKEFSPNINVATAGDSSAPDFDTMRL